MKRWIGLCVVALCLPAFVDAKPAKTDKSAKPDKKEKKDDGPDDAKKDADAEKKPEAGVNWAGQILRATGAGAPDLKASTPAQARLGAERAAQMDAFRNLLAQAKGLQISAGKTLGDEMGKDEIRGRVEGVIRGFKITNKRYFSDGGLEVDVEVPLAALTEVFAPAASETTAKVEKKNNTGLVVDARGLKVTPALSPRLLDAEGKALYSVDLLNAEGRKNQGVAAYVQSLDEAKKAMRVGERPLVVKASKADGTDLVLSADDAKKVESNASYLAEGRVIIVTQ